MKTLSKAVRRLGHAGEPIPLPFKSWRDGGVGFWRGDLGIIAGPPGIGKSTVALTLAVFSKLPTLYLSADSSTATQSTRIISMVTGIPLKSIKDRILLDGDAFWDNDWVIEAQEHSSHIKWNFSSQPPLKELDEEVDIFTICHGEPPSLIVIDNLSDIAFEHGDEFASLRELNRQLKITARDNNCAVVALHHTSESIPGDPCPPMSAIHGKVSQVPSVVLTVGVPQPGWMTVCPVKNREGESDHRGHDAIWMQYQPAVMGIRDMESGR